VGFDIYLMGHGCYRPKNESFVLPEGYAIHYYCEHGKILPERSLQRILRNMESPVRSYRNGATVPNYTWQNGRPENWNFYVYGLGLDPLNRDVVPEWLVGNMHLKPTMREKPDGWDVRYVQFFKRREGMAESAEYTLDMLFRGESGAYFSGKNATVNVHALLCSVVELPK